MSIPIQPFSSIGNDDSAIRDGTNWSRARARRNRPVPASNTATTAKRALYGINRTPLAPRIPPDREMRVQDLTPRDASKCVLWNQCLNQGGRTKPTRCTIESTPSSNPRRSKIINPALARPAKCEVSCTKGEFHCKNFRSQMAGTSANILPRVPPAEHSRCERLACLVHSYFRQ